ncbi:MAG: hypothetical protein E6Q97_14630 [Desulfurellales bacterium]|nr:MAG: hypothetical protein E6Q97_14630 [Desulfurellales bacterium]
MNTYPRGKLNADDEGALAMRLAVKDKTVIVDFGKEVVWLGLDADTARDLGRKLIKHADSIAPKPFPKKPILCLDFDGVIHRYSKGWQNGVIYDDAVPGFFEFAEAAAEHFHLVIYSSRSKTEEGQIEMALWMTAQRKKWREAGGKPKRSEPLSFEYADEKPPAFLTIDDRAVQFNGTWPDVSALKNFKPWNAT